MTAVVDFLRRAYTQTDRQKVEHGFVIGKARALSFFDARIFLSQTRSR